MSSELERLAVLESKMAQVENSIKSIDDKLDLLLAFRNKGAGVFWLVSALTTTGFVGFITWFIDSFRSH